MNTYFKPAQPAEPFQIIGFIAYCEWVNFTRGAYPDRLRLWDSYVSKNVERLKDDE